MSFKHIFAIALLTLFVSTGIAPDAIASRSTNKPLTNPNTTGTNTTRVWDNPRDTNP